MCDCTEWGLKDDERHRVGVIAQELAEVLPDAVVDNGEFLTVDDARIFYDTVAAAQELYRLTGNLEHKLGHVEKVSQKLAKFAQKRRQLGSVASGLSGISSWINATDGEHKCQSISGSLPSLASSAPSDDFHHSSPRRRKRHNNDPWRGPNSTAIQRTIVALVGVMALCLVTMCTLYVIDWYNRTFPAPRQILVMPTADPDHIGHLTEENGRYDLLWLPPEQPTAPLIGDICGSGVHCPVAY
ncbi:CBR-PQN-47 protein [Aphelenchoides avenae]|nr:CBR-PQN-47 protein [Aphelenchus avenae]